MINLYDFVSDSSVFKTESRIMNGFHFRFATEEGAKQGREVARHVLNNFLQPVE